jgi:hypothetical protein
MIDDQLFNESCMCLACQHMRRIHEDNPDLPWLSPHKYDYLHAEDEQVWTFKMFCRCHLCREERQRLRQREVRK